MVIGGFKFITHSWWLRLTTDRIIEVFGKINVTKLKEYC